MNFRTVACPHHGVAELGGGSAVGENVGGGKADRTVRMPQRNTRVWQGQGAKSSRPCTCRWRLIRMPPVAVLRTPTRARTFHDEMCRLPALHVGTRVLRT